MRFSPMKIVEGKCISKYCEVISAETLPDLSDAPTTIEQRKQVEAKQYK
jgi:hypothetical protein